VWSVAAAAGEDESGGCDDRVRDKQLQFCWHNLGSRRHQPLGLIIEIISSRRARNRLNRKEQVGSAVSRVSLEA
jgi:hypothetical protein